MKLRTIRDGPFDLAQVAGRDFLKPFHNVSLRELTSKSISDELKIGHAGQRHLVNSSDCTKDTIKHRSRVLGKCRCCRRSQDRAIDVPKENAKVSVIHLQSWEDFHTGINCWL